jgi:hypothetical protein
VLINNEYEYVLASALKRLRSEAGSYSKRIKFTAKERTWSTSTFKVRNTNFICIFERHIYVYIKGK